ncbi:MAG: acyl carrier protein [Fidelibacterota bacterium]
MQEQLITLIVDELSVPREKVTLDANLEEDLGADSLDAIQLIMSIENAFDITIPEEEAENLKTVRELLQYIEKKQ